MPLAEFPLSVPNHTGQPNHPDDVFFGEVEAIGPLVSAQTTCNRTRGRRNWPGPRIAAVVVGILLGLAVGALAGAVLDESLHREGERVFYGMGAGVLLGAVFFAWLARPWDLCSLVGQKGVALIRRRGEKVRSQQLLFEQAAQLWQKQVRMYYNGVYIGTQYVFDWLDGNGRRLFRIAGSYREKRKKPLPAGDLFHFALAAEEAWSRYRWPAIEETLRRHGPVRFPVGRDEYLEVGEGYLEIKEGRKVRRLAAADIEKVSLTEGRLVIKPRGGGWFSAYKIPSDRIGDLKLALLVLERAGLLQP